MTPPRSPFVSRGRRFRRKAFTLAELMVSMSIMAVLMGAMASAVLIATHALPDGSSTLEVSVQASAVIDEIVEDLVYTTTITEATATAISFTVADRNHGVAGPETIRITWSGTPGDPLLRQYNGGASVILCANVQSFSLSFATQPGPPPTTSNLLFVTNNAASPSAFDAAKIAIFQSWGYTVQLIAESETAAAFTAAIKASDVVYISEYVSGPTVAKLPVDGATGVVTEEEYTSKVLGISSAGTWSRAGAIDVIDNTHAITSGLPLGALTVCTSKQWLWARSGTIAAGALTLADLSMAPSLVAMEIGAARYDGGTSAGRRVMLPWGGFAFFHYDPASLNAAALGIVQRSLAWASVPSVYSTIRIRLQIGTIAATAAETSVRLLNPIKAG